MEQSVEEDSRTMLLRYIEENPGIRYRELLRMTGLVNGVLTYHLSALEKTDVVKVERQSRMTRYYPVSVSDSESEILKFVRHEPVRQIVLFILDHELCTFTEIVDHTKKAPSTVSSHLKHMKEAGIISVRYGEYQLYRLAQKELIADVLSKYRASFADRVVDNYAELVEEL
ncbi:MAG TPA: winged helix-turn-helix transcriptional regulator [Nitrososphaera sp.]|nr:winged helix-turn-helix transcriptional regulator [Nitrososphaera sp.]